jgi:hypothetical protein
LQPEAVHNSYPQEHRSAKRTASEVFQLNSADLSHNIVDYNFLQTKKLQPKALILKSTAKIVDLGNFS